MKEDLYIYRCLGYIGDYTTMLYGDYFINHSKASLYKHQVFHGTSNPGFHLVAHLLLIPSAILKGLLAVFPQRRCFFPQTDTHNWVVVSNIFYFHPEHWGRFPI